MRRVIIGLAVLSAFSPVRLSAWQCPDGTPPPCRGAAAAPVRAAAPDPNRIAVLPFRVTTADSLLGEGMAELIATEFNGESGPRAVHMGTVLRAWRRAGGGLRSPLSQQDGARLAREIGAGYLIEGSVVGLAQRLRITASVVDTRGGGVRTTEPVSGVADSIETLVSRLSAGLLAAAGGSRSGQQTRLTDSPTAMRAWLEGLAQWRRLLYDDALAAFERAFAADTLFGAAAFMRYRIGSWTLRSDLAPWVARSQRLRERLSPEDQLLLTAYFGDPGVQLTRAGAVANRRRVAARLPESPDAQYLLGDQLWHFGSAAGEVNWLDQARAQFDRALALDSLAPILQHALESALMAGDSAAARRAAAAYDRMSESPGDWGFLWIAAGATGDAALLTALRRRPVSAGQPSMSPRAGIYGLPAALTDEMFELTARFAEGESKAVAGRNYFVSAMVQGRPAAAVRGVMSWADTTRRDALLVLAAVFADGDSVAASAAAARLAASSPADSARRSEAACALGYWQLRSGAELTGLALEATSQRRCGAALALTRAMRERSADLPQRLAALDEETGAQIPAIGGFEHVLLARAYEAGGDREAALGAIRRRSRFQGLELAAATCARIEGRLAAAQGDTASAVRVYRHYLVMRHGAEPVLVPQRDSVRAELARLERR